MNFLFPSSCLDNKQVEENFALEYEALLANSHHCYLLDSDEWETGHCKIRPKLTNTPTLIYRGWMMKPNEYQVLLNSVQLQGGTLLTNVQQYQLCHHLPSWYQSCQQYTPKTVFADMDTDFEKLIKELDWQGYFVKDSVKSLTTERGSIAKTADDVRQIIADIEKFRGGIEGKICLREVEYFQSDSEERYFVYQGKPYARNAQMIMPDMLFDIADRIDSPFFSVDIIDNEDNEPRLVELGDGQVSDIKKWSVTDFVKIFANSQ